MNAIFVNFISFNYSKNIKTMKNLSLLIFALFLTAFAYAQEGENNSSSDENNENNSAACSGCERNIFASSDDDKINDKVVINDIINDANSKRISFPGSLIQDPLLDSCVAHNNNVQPKWMDVKVRIIVKDYEEDCTSDTVECSEAICKASIQYVASVADPTTAGGANDPCLVLGSQLKVNFKLGNNPMKVITTEQIVNAIKTGQGGHRGEIIMHQEPFSQSCGDTTKLPVPSGDFVYLTRRDTFIEPKSVPLKYSEVSINCTKCEETNASNTKNRTISTSAVNVNVFPNPVTDNVNFVFSTTEHVDIAMEISDVMGKMVYQTRFANNGKKQLSVDMSELKDGTYFYTYFVNNIPYKGKFVVQH